MLDARDGCFESTKIMIQSYQLFKLGMLNSVPQFPYAFSGLGSSLLDLGFERFVSSPKFHFVFVCLFQISKCFCSKIRFAY